MRRRGLGSLLLFPVILLPSLARAQINPIDLIIQDESSGNPTAQSTTSTASGLFGDTNSTWAEALQLCGCGTTADYPIAATAPASVQIAANDALINQDGLSDWLCAGCDPAFAAQVAADGGASAFQTSGLDTNPADFASADTAAGLAALLGGSPTTTTPTGSGTTPATTTAAGGASAELCLAAAYSISSSRNSKRQRQAGRASSIRMRSTCSASSPFSTWLSH